MVSSGRPRRRFPGFCKNPALPIPDKSRPQRGFPVPGHHPGTSTQTLQPPLTQLFHPGLIWDGIHPKPKEKHFFVGLVLVWGGFFRVFFGILEQHCQIHPWNILLPPLKFPKVQKKTPTRCFKNFQSITDGRLGMSLSEIFLPHTPQSQKRF